MALRGKLLNPNKAQGVSQVVLTSQDSGNRRVLVPDSSGVWRINLPAGDYEAIIEVEGEVRRYDIFIPSLEGPFSTYDTRYRRPDKAITWYGQSGTWNGLDNKTAVSTEQTVNTVSPSSWGFHLGKTMGWMAFIEGQIWICGQDQTLNSLHPSGSEFVVSHFDPRIKEMVHDVIPTSRGFSQVLGNGVTGGAYCADVAVVKVGRERWVVFMTSNPYNGWPISVFGQYPLFVVYRKIAGRWVYDPTKSATADDLQNSSPSGADAFPDTTDAWGTTYAQALLPAEVDITPASQMMVIPQYGSNPNYPTKKGGSYVVIDPATMHVRSRLIDPFEAQASADQLGPRSIECDPTGTLGSEHFFLPFDTFKTGADAGFNVMRVLKYDHTQSTADDRLSLVSNLIKTTADSADHWTNGGYDANGWMYVGRRTGATVKPVAIFPKTDGEWKMTMPPYLEDGTFAQVCDPDFTVDLPSSETSYWNTRTDHDARLKTVFGWTANFRAIGIRSDGDAHSPEITRLPIVNSDAGTTLGDYIDTNHRVLQPMDPSVDSQSRTLYAGVGSIYKIGEAWPQPPVLQPGWLATIDIDRCFAVPAFGRSTADDRLSQTSWTLALPANWAPGMVVIYVFTNTLISDPATNPITISAGWTRDHEVRNGTAGLRYLVCHRVMQSGDSVGPTLSWSGSRNLIYVGWVEAVVDTSTPIDVVASSLGPQGAGTKEVTAPIVTPSVAGCRILRAYVTQGTQLVGLSSGEIIAGEIKRRERAGTTLSACVTEEETLNNGNPTRLRTGTWGTTGLNGAFTIAVRPAPTPSDPISVSSVSLSPGSVGHGGTSTATVTLGSAAPRKTVVVLTAGNNKARVQGTLVIAAGTTSAQCTVYADTAGTCIISAKTVGASQQDTLTIT